MASSELGQKMRQAFDATMPSETAILRRHSGHLRALRSGEDLPTALHSLRRGPRLATTASVAGVALLAAAGALLFWGGAAERSVPIAPSLQRDLALRNQRVLQDGVPKAKGEPRSEPEAVLPARSATSAPVRTAASEAAVSSAERESKAGASVVEASTPSAGVEPKAEAAESWARVTVAMKARDWSAAQQALAPLLASSDEETRDSARLVRIRVALGAADQKLLGSPLLAELEELSRTGSTSSIRASARRLHKSLTEDETKHPAPDEELPLVEE